MYPLRRCAARPLHLPSPLGASGHACCYPSNMTSASPASSTQSFASVHFEPPPQPLNTPFAPPPTCLDVFSTTSVTRMQLPTVVTVVVSDAKGRSGCYPTNWRLPEITRNGFTCDACVCPRDWTAYDMRIAAYSSYIATCCSRYNLFLLVCVVIIFKLLLLIYK